MVDNINREGEGEKAGWNINSSIAYQIENLLQMTDNYFLKGKLENAYFTMSRVRIKIDANLKEEQEKELDLLEKNCGIAIRNLSVNNTNQNRQKLAHYFSKYEKLIMKLLKQQGYILAKEQRRVSF